jgi:hypothetical protein
MVVYIFVTPGMVIEKTTYILAASEHEAINIYCKKYKESPNIAIKRLKRKINKPGVFYEHID